MEEDFVLPGERGERILHFNHIIFERAFFFKYRIAEIKMKKNTERETVTVYFTTII